MMCKKVIFVVLLVGLMATLSSGVSVSPNDDLRTLFGSGSDDNGLSVKTTDTVYSWVEFTLGNVAATGVAFSLYQGDNGITDPDWEVVVRADEMDIDENTFDDYDYTLMPEIDSFFVPDSSNVWYSLNITSFYNANLGKTITFSLVPRANESGNGPKFEDREGSMGYGTAFGPRLDVAEIPEPATMLLLSTGLGLMIRRRRKI